MATIRVKLQTALLAAAALVPLRLFACGPWSEEAPPLLSASLDRLPAKSFGHLYLETRRSEAAAKPDFENEVRGLAAAVPHDERASLISRTDALLAAARDHYENGDWCNLLHDVRDALASVASNDEAAEYIAWRLAHASWFARPTEPTDRSAYPRPTPPDLAQTPEAIEVLARAEAASAALKPHYLFLRGALEFRTGDRERAEPWFRRVVDEYGDHPRAEVALFLVARCKLAQSRKQPPYEPGPDSAQRGQQQMEESRARRAEAQRLFEALLQNYPDSRFAADVDGWLGALAYDAAERTRALRHYIRQVEDRRHPEVAKSALFMCQKIVADTVPDDAERFALIAEHPLVAIGTTYLVLNARVAGREPDNYAYHTPAEEDARARQWRQAVLPRLAAEVAARAHLYDAEAWPPRYLSILAHAASAAGNHDDALKITSIASRPARGSDDLLLARGVAFQRSGRASEAIDTYRTLLKTHPQSPLARGVQLRLALALLDSKQAGAALLELTRLQQAQPGEDADAARFREEPYPPADTALDFTASPVDEDISGAERGQIVQLIDTIYNFAPLAEIAGALRGPAADDALKRQISAVLAQRYLQQENFAEAKKYLTPAEYALFAERLEALTRDVAKAKGSAAKAAAMVALADAWAAARGKLLRVPLETDEVTSTVFNDNEEQAGLRRRENARAVGTENVDDELEGRDELQHAARWWTRAADTAPGTPLAATARWRALAAMPLLAQRSGYAFQRAVETDAAGRSREAYERLRKESPDSVEASRYAAYWSFPLRERRSHEEFIFYRPEWPTAIDAVGRMGYRYLDYGAFGIAPDFTRTEEIANDTRHPWKTIRERLIALYAPDAVFDPAQLAAEVEELRAQARAAYESRTDAGYLAALDDLALFLQEPAFAAETWRAYVELRLRHPGIIEEPSSWDQREEAHAASEARLEQLLQDPALAPVADYVDFIKAVRAGQQTVSIPTNDFDKQGDPVVLRTKDYPALERAMREFLARYPASRKREAARLLLARAVHWLTTPLLTTLEVRLDGPPGEEPERAEYETIVNTYWREKFDAARALEPLDAYDREFPGGQYAAQIRDYRAGAARLIGEWALALDLTLDQLVDPAHPDLQPEAAVRLANLFAELANAERRTDMLGVVRSRPRAIERLQQYLGATWTNKDHPLRYLGAYLSDQLGIAYNPPPLPPDGS